ncbi:MAG: hypothetical protein KIT84_13555 [Labilithrix sp.]|nr:hypothetical protein [Labilithrix sp.]MCW5812044.1 hypothetical protein [Labilithrix sp.]
MRPVRALFVLGLGGATAFAACSDYETEEPTAAPADAATVDNVPASSIDASEEATVPKHVPCEAGLLDNAGCTCTTLNDLAFCSHGVVNDASACTQGKQTCIEEDGERFWTACEGATQPAATETCLNGVDDDCNGVIDDGCACSGADLCKTPDGGTYPDGRHIFTIPAAPKASEEFDIFVISRASSIPPLDLLRNGECYGEGSRRACATVGAGCPGWAVARFRNPVSAGTYTYRFETVVGSTPAPCDPQGPEFARATVTVAP